MRSPKMPACATCRPTMKSAMIKLTADASNLYSALQDADVRVAAAIERLRGAVQTAKAGPRLIMASDIAVRWGSGEIQLWTPDGRVWSINGGSDDAEISMHAANVADEYNHRHGLV